MLKIALILSKCYAFVGLVFVIINYTLYIYQSI